MGIDTDCTGFYILYKMEGKTAGASEKKAA
jgi:hypothetical protein